MSKKSNRLGPLEVTGVVLNTLGTTALVLDQTVAAGGQSVITTLQGTSSLITDGFEALNHLTAKPLSKLRSKAIVRAAKHRVIEAKAQAKAAKILATLATDA